MWYEQPDVSHEISRASAVSLTLTQILTFTWRKHRGFCNVNIGWAGWYVKSILYEPQSSGHMLLKSPYSGKLILMAEMIWRIVKIALLIIFKYREVFCLPVWKIDENDEESNMGVDFE